MSQVLLCAGSSGVRTAQVRRERRGERQGEAGREAHSVPGRKQQRKPGEGGPGRRRARGISSAAGATPRASGAAGQGAGGSRGGDKRRSPGSRGMRGLCAHPERLGLAPGGRAAGDGRAGGRGTQSCLLGPCRQRAEGQRKGRTGSTRPPRGVAHNPASTCQQEAEDFRSAPTIGGAACASWTRPRPHSHGEVQPSSRRE